MAAPTVTEGAPEPAAPETGTRSAYYLLVVGPNVTATHRLPAGGEVLVGRAEDAPVRLIDPQASRHHARIHVGDTIAIEDLSSANGTRVRDEPIAAGTRVPLGVGETVTIGSTLLTLQRREPAWKPRSLWPHGYFETRLIEECGRAESGHGHFGVVRVSVRSGQNTPVTVSDMVARVLRPGDVLASYGPGELEILLPDSAREQCERLTADVVKALAAAGQEARSALAFYPQDGTSPQSLLARACDLVLGGSGDPNAPVVRDAVLRGVYQLAERAAASGLSVLIQGETGVGKEVLARFVHERSPRAAKPFVCINCAALAESLLESELFGHEKGAFTGAVAAKAGLLEAAEGGTVFLDEVGEMSLGLQAKLLRTLERREIMRVGGTRTRAIDVRFVAATNRDLEEEVTQKSFRQDLYFRLAGMTLTVPPLRERLDEIEPLARSFLQAAAAQMNRVAPELETAAVARLRAYPWPGNVRELKNVMERALILAHPGGRIGVDALPFDRMDRATPTTPALAAKVGSGERSAAAGSWRDQKAAEEKQAISDALARCAGNQTRAAELLGMPRRTLCAKLKEYSIPRPRT